MKYFVIKFGTTGTNLAVAFAATPTKFKGYRYNASACSHQLDRVKHDWSQVTVDANGRRQPLRIEYDTPATTYPQDGVLLELTEEEYIAEAVVRGLRGAYDKTLTAAWVRGRVVAELATIAGRIQGKDKFAN